MEIDECITEHMGRCRRHPAAAAAAALSGNAQPQGPHHGTQNAIIKSLLNKLRLSGSKLKTEKFSFSIPGSASSDTPLNQVKQSDQLDRNGRLSAGISPFELARGLQPTQRPSPTVHALRCDSAGADATVLISNSTGPGQHLLPVQRSLDGGLAPQPSWGSPRSDPMCTTDAGALEAFRTLSLGGLGLGSASSSSGGGFQRFVRPANVPPLNLGRIGNREDLASKQRNSSGRQAAGLPSPNPNSQSGGGGPQPLTPHQVQQQLLESLADMEEELVSWAAPPRWNPSSQGRWYLYPPIGRKDVNPVEQLLETLAPNQASAVVLLWRQYAAARYSAELMAGRAVRLCRELGHELAECRVEVEERTQRHADHAAQLGKAIVRLQQQLEEARRAAAAATSAAAAATAAAAQQGGDTSQQPQSEQPQDGGSLRTSQVLPAQSGSPAPRQGSVTPAAHGAHASGRPGGGSSGKRHSGRPMTDGGATASVAVVVEAGSTAENEDLAAQLEQMRQLFLEAHEDSRALREALVEVDEQNMQLYEQSNGLRRHAAAVLKENDALRQEVAQLRGLLVGAGASSSGLAASAAAATSKASMAVAVTAADVAAIAPGTAAVPAPPRRARPHHGAKSLGGGAPVGTVTAEAGMRASVNLPLGVKEHLAVGTVASSTPPRPPSSSGVPAPATAPIPIPTVPAFTPVPVPGRKSDGGLTGATVRASVRRHVGSAPGVEGVGRDPHAPPLPPARASSGRAKSTHRSGNTLSGGRPTVAGSGGNTVSTSTGGDQGSTVLHSSLDGAVGKVATGSGGGADRVHRKALTDALSSEGAVVVVRASRRVGGPASGPGYTAPSRSRSTELAPGQSNFIADAALMKAAAAAPAAKVASSSGGGGVGLAGSDGGALQYSAEAPVRPQTRVPPAVP
ncbi:hypothetical protein VaNZ11_010490 [Volvox africanus]|uniref:Uncharacterized protein n=1 Tax=Volvox africanus TaxID=51714 RepID=A0ABQ5S9E6_9CHLO|nr:hypothetical protein VaNZ11_010490 [Volvox africanus]